MGGSVLVAGLSPFARDKLVDNCGVPCTGARQHWLFGVQPWGAEKMGSSGALENRHNARLFCFFLLAWLQLPLPNFLRPNSILAASNAMRGPINHCCTLWKPVALIGPVLAAMAPAAPAWGS